MLSKELQSTIISNIQEFCHNVRKQIPEEALEFISSEGYVRSQADYYESVMRDLGMDTKHKLILEIGTGFGFFMAYAIKVLNWDMCGIEPGKDKFGRFEIAKAIFDYNGIDKERLVNSSGERIKFESNNFDIVISNDVLEHVENPRTVILEALRVLKPGGIAIFNFNNYRWIYEAHYNLLWFPFMSKPLAKKYVAWRKRDSGYIDHLNFLNPTYIKKIIKNIPNARVCLPLEYKTADFMIQRVKAYTQCMEVEKRKQMFLPFFKILIDICSMKLFKQVMQIFASLTGIYHEMHLVLMKDR
ncbi:MAG: class I SAM-dependent methyltransferase [Chlamydiota bacterium]|nr:class I SAM-dependent methyltransferase [Chlamydiota bacterium]